MPLPQGLRPSNPIQIWSDHRKPPRKPGRRQERPAHSQLLFSTPYCRGFSTPTGPSRQIPSVPDRRTAGAARFRSAYCLVSVPCRCRSRHKFHRRDRYRSQRHFSCRCANSGFCSAIRFCRANRHRFRSHHPVADRSS